MFRPIAPTSATDLLSASSSAVGSGVCDRKWALTKYDTYVLVGSLLAAARSRTSIKSSARKRIEIRPLLPAGSG
jgi:hypothetical protein